MSSETQPSLSTAVPTDQYGRGLYRPDQIPPADARFAQWRGRTCHPEAVHTPSPENHDRLCVHGWIPSLDWWLHCGTCRPKEATDV